MPETLKNADPEATEQFRYTGVDTNGKPAKFSLSGLDTNDEVSVREALDHVVNSSSALTENPMLPEKLRASLQAGNLYAGMKGLNETGGAELSVLSPEQFRQMLALAVGETALMGYETEITQYLKPSEPKGTVLEKDSSFEPSASKEDRDPSRDDLDSILEKLSLSAEMESDDVKLAIEKELDTLKDITSILNNFEDQAKLLNLALIRSLNEGRQLNQAEVTSIESLTGGSDFNKLQNYLQSEKQAIPTKLKHRMEDHANELMILKQVSQDIIPQPGYTDFDALNHTRVRLSYLGEIRNTLANTQRQLEEARELLGIESNGEKEAGQDSAYRSKQVAKWANDLEAGNLDKESIESIILEMQRAVDDEVARDDADSMKKYFGDRIIRNKQKSRAGQQYSGRGYAQVGSRQYVAELMSDMLSGSFKITPGSRISLNKSAVGGVEDGQHRAAALAMIYGDNWKAIAKNMGISVVSIL